MSEGDITYVCVTKCFFQNRLWGLGETLTLKASIAKPKHFEVATPEHKLIKKTVTTVPISLFQVMKEDKDVVINGMDKPEEYLN